MAKKSVTPKQVKIDPMFFIPEGVEDIDYIEESDISSVDFDAEDDEELPADEYVSEDDVDYSENPETPLVLSIIEQKLRRAPGGQMVVDVVLDVDADESMSNYEFRVSKI